MTEASDEQAPLSPSEQLDQDDLQADPLERGAELPEGWAGADRYGMTQAEQAEGEPLDERLRQERPDIGPDDIADAGRLGDDEVLQGRVEELPRVRDVPADNADRAGGPEDDPIRGSDDH